MVTISLALMACLSVVCRLSSAFLLIRCVQPFTGSPESLLFKGLIQFYRDSNWPQLARKRGSKKWPQLFFERLGCQSTEFEAKQLKKGRFHTSKHDS